MSTGLSVALGFWMPTGTALIASTIAGQGLGVAILVFLRDRSLPFTTRLRWSLLARCSARYRRSRCLPRLLICSTGWAQTCRCCSWEVSTAWPLRAHTRWPKRTLGMPMLIGSPFADKTDSPSRRAWLKKGATGAFLYRRFARWA